jgi:hypothetical protein
MRMQYNASLRSRFLLDFQRVSKSSDCTEHRYQPFNVHLDADGNQTDNQEKGNLNVHASCIIEALATELI